MATQLPIELTDGRVSGEERYNTVNSAKVIDCAHIACDHRPVAIVMDEITGSTISVHRCQKNSSKKLYKFRWDKANLNEYKPQLRSYR